MVEDPPTIARRRERAARVASFPADVALVPLLLGLGASYWFTAAAAGTSSAYALGALAVGALVSLAFARDPFAADRYTRYGVAAIALLAIYYIVLRPSALSPGGAMLEGGRIATAVLLVWAGRAALTREASRWILLAGIGGAGIYVSARTVWNILEDGAPTVRLAGELGYWNASAIVALTLVPLAAVLARSPRRWLIPASGVLVAAASGVGAATASRGALAATMLGLLVLVLASSDRVRWIGVAAVSAIGLVGGIALLAADPAPAWLCLLGVAIATSAALFAVARRVGSVARDARVPRARRLSVFGALLCCAVVVLGGVLALDYASDVVKPSNTSDANVSRLAATDDSMRFEWWKESLQLWQDAPVFGEGGGAFETSRANLADDFAAHPHSLVLQVLAESGVLGLLLAAVGALCILRATLGAPRSPERAVASAIAVMVLGQAAIDWTWSLPQVMAVAALAVAILLPGRSRADHPITEPLTPATLPVALSTLAAIGVLAFVAVIPSVAGVLADQSARQIDDGHPKRAARTAKQSMQLVPIYPTLQLQVLALEASGQNDEAIAVLRAQKQVWSPLPEGRAFAEARLS